MKASADARAVWAGLAFTALVALCGLYAHGQVIRWGVAQPGPNNIFYRQFGLFEKPYLLLLCAALVVFIVVALRARQRSMEQTAESGALRGPSAAAVAVVAGCVFLVAWLTTRFVLRGLLFSMDEFSVDFEAKLIARGHLSTVMPGPWRQIGPALTPIFVSFDGASGRWLSQYLPVYALFKAPFLLLGAGSLVNPLFAAASVVCIALVARRLWPNESLRPWVAIAMLASSAEFLVTAGTGYSMPAHLCFNLLWLWLYLRDDNASWAAALVVGVLALGLHNPFPHALFVAPFLLRTLRNRRWGRVASAAAVYGVGGALWLAWLRSTSSLVRGEGGGVLSLFSLPDGLTLWLHGLNLTLLYTWQTPIAGVLAVVAVLQLRKLQAVFADLALGIVFTLGFFLLFASTQGHGWGYRYAFQILGNIALLAAAAVPTLANTVGLRRAQLLIAGSVALSLFVELPMRLIDIAAFTRPFSAAQQYVQGLPGIVIVHTGNVWYARDLLRNDPFLRGPVVIQGDMLVPAAVEAIKHAFPGRVTEVQPSDLFRLGMTPIVPSRRR